MLRAPCLAAGQPRTRLTEKGVPPQLLHWPPNTAPWSAPALASEHGLMVSSALASEYGRTVSQLCPHSSRRHGLDELKVGIAHVVGDASGPFSAVP